MAGGGRGGGTCLTGTCRGRTERAVIQSQLASKELGVYRGTSTQPFNNVNCTNDLKHFNLTAQQHYTSSGMSSCSLVTKLRLQDNMYINNNNNNNNKKNIGVF